MSTSFAQLNSTVAGRINRWAKPLTGSVQVVIYMHEMSQPLVKLDCNVVGICWGALQHLLELLAVCTILYRCVACTQVAGEDMLKLIMTRVAAPIRCSGSLQPAGIMQLGVAGTGSGASSSFEKQYVPFPPAYEAYWVIAIVQDWH